MQSLQDSSLKSTQESKRTGVNVETQLVYYLVQCNAAEG